MDSAQGWSDSGLRSGRAAAGHPPQVGDEENLAVVGTLSPAEHAGGASSQARMLARATTVAAERRRVLVQEIDHLPADERLALSLYFVDELTTQEIGRVLMMPEDTVPRLLARAMMRLRARIRSHSDAFVLQGSHR